MSTSINIQDTLKTLQAQRVEKKKRLIYEDKKNKKSKYVLYIDILKIEKRKCDYENEILSFELNLRNWAENENTNITDYKFIKTKTKRTLKNAIILDSKIILIIKHVSNMSPISDIKNFEYRFSNLCPIDTTNKSKFNKDDTFSYKNGDTDYIVELNKDSIKNNTQNLDIIKSTFSILNKRDVDILGCLIKEGISTEEFFTTGKVKIELNELCQKLNGYRNNYIIDEIKHSITKLTCIKIHAKTQNGSVTIDSPILRSEFISSKDNTANIDLISVIMSPVYIEEIINGSVTKIHSDILQLLKKDNDASYIIFNLQKLRIIHYYNTKDNNTDLKENLFTKTVPYTYFGDIVILSNKRKSRNLKRINECLDTIVDKGVILESYRPSGDYYVLTFFPLSEAEKNDLNIRTEKNLGMLC